MRLEARSLGKSYRRQAPLGRERALSAFSDVDLLLTSGRTLGLVGGSGAGKSSLARCLALVERPDSGQLRLDGVDLLTLARPDLKSYRRRVQLVFQDAGRAFNPRWSARRCLEEPLRLAGALEPRELDRWLELTGLASVALDRPVLELSGGQLRRLNLARALSLRPDVLILDEPFSGLDLSLQGQVANILLDLQAGGEVAMLCISHDLGLIRTVADELLVIDRGRVVETGAADEVLGNPESAITRRLLAASRGGSGAAPGLGGDG